MSDEPNVDDNAPLKPVRRAKRSTGKEHDSPPQPPATESGESDPAESPPTDASRELGDDVPQTDREEDSATGNSHPAHGMDQERGDSGKRRRKRRRGKSESGGEPKPVHAPASKVDPEVLAKAAWKIYLAEISEEGVALVSDKDARELANRCFRLAEVFLEERDRKCGGPPDSASGSSN